MELIKETDLPGIGKKVSMVTRDGNNIFIIIHDDGIRELYLNDNGNESEPKHIITMDSNEARKISGILGGMTYVPRALESIRDNLKELTIDWRKMEPDFVCQKPIGEFDIRNKKGVDGVSIIAIIREEGTNIINPEPNELLYARDIVVVAGTREQLRNFYELLRNKDE